VNLDTEIENLYYAEVVDNDDISQEMTVTMIAKETGASLTRVRRIIFGEDETGSSLDCPYYIRKNHPDSVPVKKYKMIKGHLFLKTEANALALIQRGLRQHLESGNNLTINELKDLTGMLTNLDKMNRLEDGRPTDIIKSINYSPKRIIEIIESDPMYAGRRRIDYEEEESEYEESKRDLPAERAETDSEDSP